MIVAEYSDSFLAIKDIWAELRKNDSLGSAYQSLDYMGLFWRHRIPYQIILRMRPLFCIFSENGNPLMILPLFLSLGGRKAILFGYKAGFGYLDIVSGQDMSEEKITACLHLLREQKGIVSIYSTYVKEDTIWGQYLLHHGGEYCDPSCVCIQLPDEYQLYFNGLSKNARQNIRTAYNRLAKDSINLEFDHYDSSELSAELRKELQKIYIQRQITRYKKTGLAYTLFYKYIDLGTYAEKSKNNIEQIFVLKCNGTVSAYFDAVVGGEEIIVPRLAINDAFARYSPGVLLIDQSIHWLLENTNIRSVDLTHGEEAYKIAMGGIKRRCVKKEINL